MDWLQIDEYMVVVEKEKTTEQYQALKIEQNEHYDKFIEMTKSDESFVAFIQQFGVMHARPLFLQSLPIEQGKAMMFTGKYYFEGYLEFGEYDLWDIVVGDAVCSFTKEEKAPFLNDEASYVEISFEFVKRIE